MLPVPRFDILQRQTRGFFSSDSNFLELDSMFFNLTLDISWTRIDTSPAQDSMLTPLPEVHSTRGIFNGTIGVAWKGESKELSPSSYHD